MRLVKLVARQCMRLHILQCTIHRYLYTSFIAIGFLFWFYSRWFIWCGAIGPAPPPSKKARKDNFGMVPLKRSLEYPRVGISGETTSGIIKKTPKEEITCKGGALMKPVQRGGCKGELDKKEKGREKEWEHSHLLLTFPGLRSHTVRPTNLLTYGPAASDLVHPWTPLPPMEGAQHRKRGSSLERSSLRVGSSSEKRRISFPCLSSLIPKACKQAKNHGWASRALPSTEAVAVQGPEFAGIPAGKSSWSCTKLLLSCTVTLLKKPETEKKVMSVFHHTYLMSRSSSYTTMDS